jgi:hypothetical protein
VKKIAFALAPLNSYRYSYHMTNATPRHLCPACNGEPARCDVCLSTGRRLCDSCLSPDRQRAVASVDGTALCLHCLLSGLVEDEREHLQSVQAWREAHRSPIATRAHKSAAYERMTLLARQLAETRAAAHEAMMASGPANDVKPAPLVWSPIELRVGLGLIFGELAGDRSAVRVRWTQHGEPCEVTGPTVAEAMDAARARIAELNRLRDLEDAEDTLVTGRPSFAAE